MSVGTLCSTGTTRPRIKCSGILTQRPATNLAGGNGRRMGAWNTMLKCSEPRSNSLTISGSPGVSRADSCPVTARSLPMRMFSYLGSYFW